MYSLEHFESLLTRSIVSWYSEVQFLTSLMETRAIELSIFENIIQLSLRYEEGVNLVIEGILWCGYRLFVRRIIDCLHSIVIDERLYVTVDWLIFRLLLGYEWYLEKRFEQWKGVHVCMIVLKALNAEYKMNILVELLQSCHQYLVVWLLHKAWWRCGAVETRVWTMRVLLRGMLFGYLNQSFNQSFIQDYI
jgi:hypothetical protein